MHSFEESVRAAEALIAAAEQGEGAYEAAELALDEVRNAWKSLDEAKRAEALPTARELAARVQSLRLPVMSASAVPLRFYDGTPDADSLLEWFGLESFRPGQREAVEAALGSRDSLVVMPTGGGKTLCYQLPGIATNKLTVVVSPLVALIQDQHQRLRSEGHPSVMLAGSSDDNYTALDAVRDGTARIVFAAPERFASKSFLDAVSSRDVSLFVVDEAHCISEWGHDFRPDYLRLTKVIESLGRPTVMACTATATPTVAEEIASRLGLEDPEVVRGGFDRPNISFDVIPLGGKGSIARKRQLLVSGLSLDENRPAIVYCGTRKDVDEVTALLKESGLRARSYHAGKAPEEREEAQRAFMTGASEVIVATNAFGMGVDKASVRSVWHWALPTSLEAYYQEAGRAGRDGLPAKAVLLSLRADLGRLLYFNKGRSTDVDSVQAAVTRLERDADAGSVYLDVPLEDDLRLCLAIAERAGALTMQPATSSQVEVVLHGKLDRRKAHEACQVAKSRGWEAYRAVERFSASEDSCHRRQLLDHFSDPTPGAPLGRCCSVCDPIDWLPALTEPAPAVSTKRGKPKSAKADGVLTAAELTGPLAEALKAWRLERASGKPAYTVCPNATLAAIVELKPDSKAALLEIHGVGPGFIQKHADSLLELLAAEG